MTTPVRVWLIRKITGIYRVNMNAQPMLLRSDKRAAPRVKARTILIKLSIKEKPWAESVNQFE